MWNKITTAAGEALIASAAGRVFNYTRVAFGAGRVPVSRLAAQTSVSEYVKDFQIIGVSSSGNVSHLNARLDNRGIGQARSLSQIGLFANVGGGAEVLAIICQNDTPNNVPSESQQAGWVYEPQIDAVISGVAEITANINWNAFVTREELENMSFGIPPGNIRNIRLSTYDNDAFLLKWGEPEDITVGNTPLIEWEKTKIVRKIGSFPENEKDGTVVYENYSRDKYYDYGLVDTDVESGVFYGYGLFPIAKTGAVNRNPENRISGFIGSFGVMTAAEFDARGLTAQQFDNLGLTALQFDTQGIPD
jgi:hypothetical protein